MRGAAWLRPLSLLVIATIVMAACGGGSSTTPAAGGLGGGTTPPATSAAASGGGAPPAGSPTTASGGGGQIVIGGLATLEGPFAVDGEDAFRGVQMAIDEFGGKVAGKEIKLVKEGTDATPQVARDKARKLIEQDKVDFIIGPLSGDEGLAVRDYAKTVPDKTFINGSSAAQDTTLRDPAPNFFRFSTDGAQWMAGLGTYVYNEKGYKRMAVLAEDYSFPYSQVGGFMTEYCRAGGHVVKKFWVPIGTKDYSSVVSNMPKDIDAIFVMLGGSDAVNFIKAYDEFGGKAKIVGSSVTVDQTVLSTKGTIAERVIGIPSAGPIADNNPDPAWQKFVADYKQKFPDGFASPSLFAHAYYIATKAALTALQQINGDLSDGQKKFQQTLSTLELDTPTGKVKLDHNRNAIANIYLTEVAQKEDGTLYNKLVKVTENVNQTLGVPEDEFLKMGPFNRDNPSCP
ncbi:MAG: ABC transporter substrate-binding protein [Thermomicrobiaceae bacterium]|nr:ABC transporter substrate-binding protein [Thermomicrobiaceae bacterium]